MSEPDDEYMRLTVWLHHAAEQAEARAERADRLARKLTESGLLADGVILGPIVHQRGYSPGRGGSDSAQFVQAVLRLPGGIGAVLWDLEEYLQLEQQEDGLEVAAMAAFLPLADCELAVKALLLPHIPALVGRLRKRLR